MRSDSLREQAIAEFRKADALVDKDLDAPKAEDQAAFDEHFAAGSDLMEQYRKAAAAEGKIVSLREALGDVAGAVRGGAPIPLQSYQVDAAAGRTLGERYVASEEYKELLASGALNSDKRAFRAQGAPVGYGQRLGRMYGAASDVISTGGGGGGALVTPQYLPGIVPLPQRPLAIRDLFSQGEATSDVVSYAQQTAFDAASGLAVAQSSSATDAAGLKKQSSVGWQRVTSPVETLATWMAVTRQALADAGQIRALIDNQGELMLRLEEEDQLLNGDGTSPNLSGIFDQAIQTLDLTGEDNLDGIRTARRLVRTGISRATADGIVVHPIDSEEFDLLKDDFGQYRGGNPIGNFTFDQPIWGLRRVESEAIAEGTALVGAFRVGATVLERQGVTVLTADQHADFFIRNLVVILFEERLGFPVYFPSAFVEVTLAGWGS